MPTKSLFIAKKKLQRKFKRKRPTKLKRMQEGAPNTVEKMGVVKSLKTMARSPGGADTINRDAAVRSKHADAVQKRTGKRIRRRKGFGLAEHPNPREMSDAMASEFAPVVRRTKPRARRGPNQ